MWWKYAFCVILAFLLVFIIYKMKDTLVFLCGLSVIVGMCLNMTVVIVNDGKMPIEERYITEKDKNTYTPSENAKLTSLSDFIPCFGGLVSPGDLFLMTGIFILYPMYLIKSFVDECLKIT